jgi:hypothetical protein
MLTIVFSMPHVIILYLEPTTSGVLLQILLGGVTGLLVIVKLFWYRLSSLFRRGRSTVAQYPEAIDPEGQQTNESEEI